MDVIRIINFNEFKYCVFAVYSDRQISTPNSNFTAEIVTSRYTKSHISIHKQLPHISQIS